MKTTEIANPSELRSALLHCVEGVMEGRISVPQANAIANLSSELHKSIRQEWDMRVYAAEHLQYGRAELKKVIGRDGDE